MRRPLACGWLRSSWPLAALGPATQGSASGAVLRVRKWSALRAWGLRIAKRSSMLCAIVAVAAQACGHPASNVGQRNRLPCRLRCQGHAATAIEACAVIAVGSRWMGGVVPSMSRRSKGSRLAVADSLQSKKEVPAQSLPSVGGDRRRRGRSISKGTPMVLRGVGACK
jgi:hypothetical protein